MLGRTIADVITTVGTGVSAAVRARGYAFNSAGLPATQTTYSDTSMATVVTQVGEAYNNLEQLTYLLQPASGSVSLYDMPYTQYVYTDLSDGLNDSRLTAMIYPDGRIEDYDYSATQMVITGITHSSTTATATYFGTDPAADEQVFLQGATDSLYDGTVTITGVNTSMHTFTYNMSSSPAASATGTDITATPMGLDEVIGRTDGLQDHNGYAAGTALVGYTYLGLGTIVQETQGNGNTLSYINQGDSYVLPSGTATSGNDRYTGLDRWGEVVDQNWFNSSGGTLSRIQYGYDADGNVLSENNLVETGDSKTFSYDDLNQLTGYEEGTLSEGAITGTPTTDETWSLDALGNWISNTVNGTETDDTTNGQNELTAVGDNTQTFDDDGNTLVGVVPGSGSTAATATMTYNAWNQMTAADVGGTTVDYSYNALGQRITITTGGVTQQQFLSMSGQVLETDQLGTGLGLSICRDIVNHHHGRIEVESQVGKGTTFSIYLPGPRKAA